MRHYTVALTFAALVASIWSCSTSESVDSQRSASTATTIQAYIDEHYYADADIKHSFHTKAGEQVDCIDFYAQRSVKGFAAHGIALDANHIPPTPTPPSNIPQPRKPSGSVAFDGSLDADGKARACPTGTVPTHRPTVARIAAAGGIDAFKKRERARPRPLDTNQDTGQHDAYDQRSGGPNWNHAAGYTNQSSNGALTYVSVHQPTVADIENEHSLSQMWIQTNECEDWNQPYLDTNTCSTAADAGATTAAVNSLEVGWMVGNGGSPLCSTEYAGDASAIAACELQPYIFSFITQNGYAVESGVGNCFAGGAGGGSQECCPSATGDEGTDCWVAVAGAPFVVGQTLGSYVQPIGDPPAEMAIQVWNGWNYGYYAWFVYIDGNLIGYYPTGGHDPLS